MALQAQPEGPGPRGATRWDPDQYLKFTDQRLRPSLDLLAQVPLTAPRVIYDLGVSDEGKRLLARAFPPAEVKAAAREQQTTAYVEQHRADLDALRDFLQRAVAKYADDLEGALYAEVAGICGAWPEAMRTDLFARYLGFPFWDVIVHPMQALATVDERDHVEVVRISPLDAKHLGDDGPKKLKGIGLHHFAAFFKREYRENDYLWGRLDAAERLVRLLLDDPNEPHLEEAPAKECRPFFEAIMNEEAGDLRTIPDVIANVRQRIARIPKV